MSVMWDEGKQRNVDLDFEELTSQQEDFVLENTREGDFE